MSGKDASPAPVCSIDCPRQTSGFATSVSGACRNASTKDVLPAPASPIITIVVPSPADARANPEDNRASSRARPTNNAPIMWCVTARIYTVPALDNQARRQGTQGSRSLACIDGAVLDPFCHQTNKKRIESWRKAWSQDTWSRRVDGRDRLHYRKRAAAFERSPPGCGVIQDTAEREHICARRARFASRLFGRHVVHRARELGTSSCAFEREISRLDRTRKSEVRKLGAAAGGEQDVSWSDVVMNDAHGVRRG